MASQATVDPGGKRHSFVREASPGAADLFDDHSLDFVYIDGAHELEAVRRDIAAWCGAARVLDLAL